MRLLAPAKINLHLRVFRARSDGFHPLLSWMCTVGLFDTLTLEGGGAALGHTHAPLNKPDGPISLNCDVPDLPCDARNLVVRIATAFAQDRSIASALHATLQKR